MGRPAKSSGKRGLRLLAVRTGRSGIPLARAAQTAGRGSTSDAERAVCCGDACLTKRPLLLKQERRSRAGVEKEEEKEIQGAMKYHIILGCIIILGM